MKSIHNLNITSLSNGYQVFGNVFRFDPYSDKSQRAAFREAEEFALGRLSIMESQAKRKLSARERIEGKFTAPPAPKTIATQNAPDLTKNPYTEQVDYWATKVAYTAADRSRKADRIEFYTRLRDNWQPKVVTPAEVDPELERAKRFASQFYEATIADPTKTIEETLQARKLKEQLDKGEITTGEFWQTAQLPDEAANA